MKSCIVTCILTEVTQPFSLQSIESGALAPDVPKKDNGSLLMSAGGVSVPNDCWISSSVYDEEIEQHMSNTQAEVKFVFVINALVILKIREAKCLKVKQHFRKLF